MAVARSLSFGLLKPAVGAIRIIVTATTRRRFVVSPYRPRGKARVEPDWRIAKNLWDYEVTILNLRSILFFAKVGRLRGGVTSCGTDGAGLEHTDQRWSLDAEPDGDGWDDLLHSVRHGHFPDECLD